MDKIGFGGDGWEGQKKLKKPRTCINGCSLKAHQLMDTLVQNVHQKILQCQCSSEGQVVACPGKAMDGDNRLATSDYVSADGDGSISSSIQSVSSYSTLTQKTFDQSLPPLKFDRSSVWLCYLQQSNAWTTEKLSLQWEDMRQATAQVLDYSQPKSQHGQQVITIHLYDCFI